MTTAESTPTTPAARTFTARRLTGEAVFVALGMVASIATQSIALKVVTTMLSSASFAYFALANSALGLFQSVTFGALFTAMTRRAPSAVQKGQLPELLADTSALARPVLLLVALFGVLLAAVAAALGHSLTATVILTSLLLCYGTYRNNRTIALEQVGRLRVQLVVHTAVDGALRVGLFVFVLRLRNGAASALAASAVAMLVANYLFERRTETRLTAQAETVEPAENARANLVSMWVPVAITSVLAWGYTNTDRWFIERFLTLEQVALYAAAAQLAALPFTVLSGLIANFSGPILFRIADTDPARARRWTYVTALGYVLISVVGWLVLTWTRDFWVHLLIGRPLWGASRYVPGVAAGWALMHAGTIFQVGLLAESRASKLLAPSALAMIVAMGCHAFFLPRYGAAAAAIGLCAAGVVRTAGLALAFALVGREARVNAGSADATKVVADAEA